MNRVAQPESDFSQHVLNIYDFDGTMYETFEADPSRQIYGVDEAYRIAIEEVFYFDKDALRRYIDDGEHQNRTPLEIVNSLAPDCTLAGLDRLTGELVGAKLNVLAGQIGRELQDGELWPRPVPGFLEHWQQVTAAKEDGAPISQAIASAGHASFIRKCLAQSKLVEPEIMVTDETIRGLNSSLPPEQLAKPSIMPVSIIKTLWLAHHNQPSTLLGDPSLNDRIIIVGDSKEKDGGLARNCDTQFIHISPDNPADGWHELTNVRLGLGHISLNGTGQGNTKS